MEAASTYSNAVFNIYIYQGQYISIADFTQAITEETTNIPESLTYYIDYKKMARDMELNCDIFTFEKHFEEIHLFWNH